MKISDLLRLAVKNLKGRWVALPIMGFAIAAFCLCFAGAILTTVQEEKAQAYELVLSSASTELSDSAVTEISQIEDVTAATAVLEVPVTITAGECTEELTLTGIDPEYLEADFAQGGIFPDDSVMPYIVLNDAASKLFTDEEGEAYDIDTLNGNFFVQMGEEAKAVTSKVCGILSEDEDADEEEVPKAYVSLTVAKELLRQSGQGTDYITAYVRVTNIGCAASISKEIQTLGFSITNSTEELQAEWDDDMREMAYLVVISVFCLICTTVLMAAWRKISLFEQKEAYVALRWIGMREKEIRRLFIIQSVMISLLGIIIGTIISVSLPSFLSTELQGTSMFMLSVPFWIAVLSAVVCVISGLIPFICNQTKINTL